MDSSTGKLRWSDGSDSNNEGNEDTGMRQKGQKAVVDSSSSKTRAGSNGDNAKNKKTGTDGGMDISGGGRNAISKEPSGNPARTSADSSPHGADSRLDGKKADKTQRDEKINTVIIKKKGGRSDGSDSSSKQSCAVNVGDGGKKTASGGAIKNSGGGRNGLGKKLSGKPARGGSSSHAAASRPDGKKLDNTARIERKVFSAEKKSQSNGSGTLTESCGRGGGNCGGDKEASGDRGVKISGGDIGKNSSDSPACSLANEGSGSVEPETLKEEGGLNSVELQNPGRDEPLLSNSAELDIPEGGSSVESMKVNGPALSGKDAQPEDEEGVEGNRATGNLPEAGSGEERAMMERLLAYESGPDSFMAHEAGSGEGSYKNKQGNIAMANLPEFGSEAENKMMQRLLAYESGPDERMASAEGSAERSAEGSAEGSGECVEPESQGESGRDGSMASNEGSEEGSDEGSDEESDEDEEDEKPARRDEGLGWWSWSWNVVVVFMMLNIYATVAFGVGSSGVRVASTATTIQKIASCMPFARAVEALAAKAGPMVFDVLPVSRIGSDSTSDDADPTGEDSVTPSKTHNGYFKRNLLKKLEDTKNMNAAKNKHGHKRSGKNGGKSSGKDDDTKKKNSMKWVWTRDTNITKDGEDDGAELSASSSSSSEGEGADTNSRALSLDNAKSRHEDYSTRWRRWWDSFAVDFLDMVDGPSI